MHTASFGILTVSDTAYQNTVSLQSKDTAGPRLQSEIKKFYPHSKVFKKIVPDEVDEIRSTLQLWVKCEYNVIFTVGGTGFGPRDVTPEATRAVIEREAPGIAYTMIAKSLAVTDMAMLSRAVSGISGKSLIINFPGSAKAAVECFGFINSAIPHAIELLTDKKELIANTHKCIQENTEGARLETESMRASPEAQYRETYTTPEAFTGSKVKMNAANRNRKSPYPMIEVEAAIDIVFKESRLSSELETIDIYKAMDRVLAEDIYAVHPVPPFRASIKDGYAVRSSDGDGDRIVKDVTAAGDKPCEEPLQKGEIIRICTGAPIPPGADAVVMVEDTTLIEKSQDGAKELRVKINVAPRSGQDIREIGSDIAEGQLVLPKFEGIRPADIGILAMLGLPKVKVFKRVAVGVLTTGNELKAPNEELSPGQIYDSNKYALTNLLKRYSCESNDCGIAKDNPNSLKLALDKAFTANDVIITTGGVSMGEFDLVKEVLEKDFDAVIHFARVNMKPGKPTTFATLSYRGHFKMVFALPGNPVSCCVTCLLYVIPALRYMERRKVYKFPVVWARFENGVRNSDARPEYHRVAVSYDNCSRYFKIISTGNQISSRLNSLAGANGLAIVPNTEKSLCNCNVILFDEFNVTNKFI